MAKFDQCIAAIRRAGEAGQISESQAQELIDEIMSRVQRTEEGQLTNLERDLDEIGNKIIGEAKLARIVQRKNALLKVQAIRKIENFVTRFNTIGEGVRAYNDGTRELIEGGRLSVDAQQVAIRNKYVGTLAAELDKADLIREFRSGELDQEIFQEMWAFDDPTIPDNPSGSVKARKIAEIIKNIHREMIPRLNRAGGFIKMHENYVMLQAHDREKIRKAGTPGRGMASDQQSFDVWSRSILPLLNDEKTFEGVKDKMVFLKNVHEGILTGVHGVSGLKVTDELRTPPSLAKKISARRILHFKDADAAWSYNKTFGMRSLRDGILNDFRRAANVTALMENWGPNPEDTWNTVLRRLKERAKTLPDGYLQVRALENTRLKGSFMQLTGAMERPANPTLHTITRALLAHSTISRLPNVLISAIPDKGFFQSAMSFQGMRTMDIFREQFAMFIPKTKEERIQLRLMGAAIDGWLGDVHSRFASEDNTRGRLFKLQQSLFKINGMNWWNDVHKGAAAKLTTSWFGEHANLGRLELPDDLGRVLDRFAITSEEWNAMRRTSYTVGDHPYITPDQFERIPQETIDNLLDLDGRAKNKTNRFRKRDELETKYRTLITDQVDDAVVTPDNRTRLIANLNTQAGTLKGMGARLLMHLKSFPIAVWERVIKREIYGHGADTASFKSWLLSNKKGNFRMIQLIAMTTIGGYISISIKDALKGRTPRRITNDDGSINGNVLTDAMLRGGGLGIYGDFLFTEYDRSYRNFFNTAAGPILGQVPELMAIKTDILKGKNVSRSAEKLAFNNTPYINLFYIRPALDYLILWNIQEMLDPGSLRRKERDVEKRNNQGFFIRPSEVVRR